ncbi:MAG: hypothetical protein U9Q82_11865, partial [Chloroflexota bacterium]|nr:hypothetical protein [Chloroflexota bacterium]
LHITQITPDSASPQGEQRDFGSFGVLHRMFRDKDAKRVNTPLDVTAIFFSQERIQVSFL